MADYGASDTSTTTLGANQFPISEVYVPNGTLTALEGGPASTDGGGKKSAPASMYVKDGGDVAQGLTTDVAVTGDNAGTLSAKLRGLMKILTDVWDSVNHRIKVDGSGVTQPTQRNTIAVYTLASTLENANGNSGDLAVGPYTEVSIDINTTAQAGTNPTVQFFWERKGADGIYYVLWQSNVLTVAANTISTSVGAGMAYNQSLGLTGRFRWVIGGTVGPSYTFSVNVYGK